LNLPVTGPALAMILLDSVPGGLRALDALAKEAPVEVLATGTIQRGMYLIAFAGEVDPVQRSFARACAVSDDGVFDSLLLPYAEEHIVPAMMDARPRSFGEGDTLGSIQCAAPPTLVRAVDAALKGAMVELVELRLGDGLGGKALASLWGATHDVEAAIGLANQAIARGRAAGASTVVIPNADPVVRSALADGSRFFKEWRG